MVNQLSADEADRQDIRIAVVLNGGVSLAVWIGGVVSELHRLVQASRAPKLERRGDVYAELLDFLDATARIDVIAGTSAGGLNGGFLALGLVHGCELSTMRDLWENDGSLSDLLRDPRQKDSPSLLRGEYFYERLHEAYRAVWAGPRRHAGTDEPVELFLTGTLWNGRRSPFTDDMGRAITEVDYDATFRFASDPDEGGDPGDRDMVACGDLRRDRVVEELAVASRCTSSFPGAFEPFRVAVDIAQPRIGDRWTTTGGLANFGDTQYVVDGGILLNKPIRPAIDAVYRQPASSQVRRILAYVVPDPGEGSEQAGSAEDRGRGGGGQTDEEPPRAQQVLLGVLTRLRSTDSVSSELAEIGRRNEAARLRRRTRDRFATALTAVSGSAPTQDGDTQRTNTDLPEAAWGAYHEVRVAHAARIVGGLLASGQTTTSGGWSRRELAEALRRIAAAEGLPFIPSGTLDEALVRHGSAWDWGQTTVTRLGEMAVDVLKRAMWVAPIGSDLRRSLGACRKEVHGVLTAVRADRQELNRFWRRSGSRLPRRGTGAMASPAELVALDAWLGTVLTGWEGDDPARRRAQLHDQALALARRLFDYREPLRGCAALPESPVDPGGDEINRLQALVDALLDRATAADDVLRRMLRLDVVQLAFAGAAEEVEQEVELVQVSSRSRDLLTGVQEHHFGAFYRRSWRINDWLHGRLDGAAQLVGILLAPERLLQREHKASSAYDEIHALAVGPADDPDHDALEAEWAAHANRVRAELSCLDNASTTPLPQALPLSAARVARRLHIRILRAELPALAKSIDMEPDPLPASARWAQQVKEATREQDLTAGALQRLHEDGKAIGRQRIRQEIAMGTDTFARTITHASAALTATIGTVKPKVVGSVLSALRGYALMLWALINFSTQRSHFGANVVNLLVGIGAALVAVTLVVPGVPIGVTLAGVFLVLAAASAAALVEHETRRSVGGRLILAALVAAAALAATVIWDLLAEDDTQARSTALSALGKIAIVAAVIALGWWVARARPAEANPKPRSTTPSTPP